MDRRTTAVLACAAAMALAAAGAGAATRLLRYPDIHAEQVAFSYAGDIWLAPAGGGTAFRLTSHPGLEVFPKFSPDGSRIAFTGQYDGDEQVYVIPASGGVPRQLTFYPAAGPLAPRWGYDHQVYGWTPDGSAVLFRSMRHGWDLTDAQLFTVGVDGGMPRPLPMPESGAGDFSPDGERIVYSPLFRDFRHWKRYQGGWAQDLYIFDLATYEATRVTDDARSDRDPMWIGDTIYFSSDRTGILNLFAYDIETGETRQLTDSELWDVRWPSADPATGRIVYETNGRLAIFDIAGETSTAIEIRVPTDGLAMRPGRVDASTQIEDFGLSPKGERALFAARGDIFTAPIEAGPTRNLTRTSGAHDRSPAWSPDGREVAFLSDRDGEEEVWIVAQDGRGKPRQLTDGSVGRLEDLGYSPDGRFLAYRDQAARLFVVDVASGERTQLADDPSRFGLEWDWSPDGRFLAYTLADPSTFHSIHLWSAADGVSRRVTSDLANDFSPTWDPEGDYLFYLSDREYAPQIGSFEFNYVVDRETYAYALALRRDVAHPFPPKSDEVTLATDEKDEKEGAADEAGAKKRRKKDGKQRGEEDDGEAAAPAKAIRIDFEGLGRRVSRVPLPAANYFALVATKGHLLVLEGSASYYGRAGDFEPRLQIFSLEKPEAKPLIEGVQGFAVSADGSKVMARTAAGFQVLDAAMGGAESAKPVPTAGLVVDRVPSEEWAQIFDEVWRRFRDYFYVENMHGWDWAALRERYRPWLEHVGHRSDLNYVISEMIAELEVSHAYITGGDYEIPARPRPGLLGARFELDEEAGRYRISRIFAGDNAEDLYRSPLTEVGVEVEVGDYLLAVNGVELTADDNPFRLLRDAGAGPLELAVGASGDLAAARHVVVSPIPSEDDLIYLDWIEGSRRAVEERTAGRVGYIHLPNMGGSGIRQWVKWFYPQIRKEGLIIDVRSNGGGNVSSMIVERLQRELLMVDFERNQDLPDPYPGAVFHGHLVCLLDEDTASDGDQFAYVFRQAGLGPLIGKRSWGGVVGIYGGGPLIDGGGLSVPEAGSASAGGDWVMEGHGVDPDIEVENEPGELLAGRDQQLEKAIEVILEKIETEPKRFPERPAPPVKEHASR